MTKSMGLESVSREALDSDAGSHRSSSTDHALEARFHEHLRAIYDTSIAHTTPVDEDVTSEEISIRPGNGPESDAEEDYEFRLFSGPKAGKAVDRDCAVQRIAIKSPTPVNGEGGFVISQRPNDYYFAKPPSDVGAEQIAAAAVSGEDILEGLNLRWRGCELPWRVTVIRVPHSNTAANASDVSRTSGRNTKKRIGKKRRIAIRKKVQAIAEKKIAVKRSQMEKEVAGKEKRTRRNREKKVKKKLKEKAQKIADVVQNDG